MRALLLSLLTLVCVLSPAKAQSLCERTSFEDVGLIVCDVPAQDVKALALFHMHPDGLAVRSFSRLQSLLEAQGHGLAFAFNAGMYHRDLSPVGLYVENGVEQKAISTLAGPGNFHLLPNGVFYLAENGTAGVLETPAYIKANLTPRFASQSGPMLVINGALHPRFIATSNSLKIRNGVGVRGDGSVVFVLSEQSLNFHQFARYFKDQAKTPNALYFDGTISSAYIPELGRSDFFFPMGPMVAMVRPQ
jgi:uncharacterized protein YigE (DUF2233 family)